MHGKITALKGIKRVARGISPELNGRH